MTDAREALVALAESLTRAADRCCQCADGHHDQMPPYGTDDDVRISRDDARKIADAILAEFDVTERVHSEPECEYGVRWGDDGTVKNYRERERAERMRAEEIEKGADRG